jgi:hypothetical protein
VRHLKTSNVAKAIEIFGIDMIKKIDEVGFEDYVHGLLNELRNSSICDEHKNATILRLVDTITEV